MNFSNLVFVGIKGWVVALDRSTGTFVWKTHLKGSDFVNVTLEGNDLFALTSGEMFCLDPATGNVRWHNRLQGYGTGLATIATSPTSPSTPVMAEKRRRDQQAAAAASAA